ncbi:MAG: hypothetical protein N2Z40_07560 [Caldimicrobium sp.]|nr:hypothetical protein [Caldimicrobium sp.]
MWNLHAPIKDIKKLQRLEAIKDASQRKEVAFRLKVIEFHNSFGREAPVEAFGICKATIKQEWDELIGVSLRLGNVSFLKWICYKLNENSPQSKILWLIPIWWIS